MKIPMVNLRPMLAATEPAWRANLERLFDRMHFILGEQVAAFESEFAAAFGVKHALAVGTGTAAIELGLRAIGLGDSGAEVIVPALTSPFTGQAVLAAGCKPRFADIEEGSLLLAPDLPISRRTRAVIPVHLYGQPCDLPRGIPVVQDACQAHGAPVSGQVIAYSFYPTKNLPCLGDGGAVTTNSASIASRLRSLRDGGRRNNDQVARERAVNSRLDEMQACYLRAFLPKLLEWNAARVRLAALYDAALGDCRGVRSIARRSGSVCHLYVVRAARRDRLRRYLTEHGIMTGVHYPVPLHLQPAFQGRYRKGSFPIAERACREILSLPLWPGMPDSAVEEVATRMHQFYR